jgi:hypothetical protein
LLNRYRQYLEQDKDGQVAKDIQQMRKFKEDYPNDIDPAIVFDTCVHIYLSTTFPPTHLPARTHTHTHTHTHTYTYTYTPHCASQQVRADETVDDSVVFHDD